MREVRVDGERLTGHFKRDTYLLPHISEREEYLTERSGVHCDFMNDLMKYIMGYVSSSLVFRLT